MSSKKSKRYTKIQDYSGRVEETPHELEFTATVAGWMSLIIERDPTLPFSKAKCEGRTRGTQKRRDLSLMGKDGKVLVTGEVKLPYQKDGATPYNSSVVKDARRKAQRAGAEYFFTWNVNDCVLWETETDTSSSTSGQHYQAWKVVTVSKDTHLTLPSTEDTIKRWLGRFLNDLAKIIRGTAKVGVKAPDERFIEALESALTLPIRLTFEALEGRYATNKGKADIDRWMRDDQGWTITTDPEGVRDNLERTAKFTCYALVNKLVFYEALMKRYGAHLAKLNVPEHIDTGMSCGCILKDFSRRQKPLPATMKLFLVKITLASGLGYRFMPITRLRIGEVLSIKSMNLISPSWTTKSSVGFLND